MSNYVEYKNVIAFHPGYYVKETIEEYGITQEDFAKRLNTTPKNLSVLLSGDQSLSGDMAMKLSRMLGTTVEYWMNLQSKYDALIAEIKAEETIVKEREVFEMIDYRYFIDNCGLPHIPRRVEEQMKCVREYIGVASLEVLKNKDLAVSFRSENTELCESNIVNANVMVQIAIKKALETEAPDYNKTKFLKAIEYALTLTSRHEDFYPLVKEAFREAGVVLIALPNLKGSKINGATKRLGKKVLLMVNDRRMSSDIFWFSMLHEAGHIVNGDYMITFTGEEDDIEKLADEYAGNKLIPQEKYKEFTSKGIFNEQTIRAFAEEINRDPGIVLGRLQKDNYLSFGNNMLNKRLKHKYEVVMS